MTSPVTAILRSLLSSRYLASYKMNQNGALAVELLSNGSFYADQLKQQWLHAKEEEGLPPHYIQQQIDEHTQNTDTTNRLQFLQSKTFRKHLHYLRSKPTSSQCPAVIKTVQLAYDEPIAYTLDAGATAAAINLPSKALSNATRTFLITEYFVRASNGLENFYNMQREHKIWWMRFSSNPSRYFWQPFDLQNSVPAGTQSVTLKSQFSFTTAHMEHITLVPLAEITNNADNANNFELLDSWSGKSIFPAIIRSVIDLEAATSAMLFDSFDNKRVETLLLNRKLAPYQCAIACFHEDSSAQVVHDMRDLRQHLSLVLQRAGLRIYADHEMFTDSSERLQTDLHEADRIGVNYVLLVGEETLQNGLLKLRNRDTTLMETIHISDIPDYLINIFSS